MVLCVTREGIADLLFVDKNILSCPVALKGFIGTETCESEIGGEGR